MVITNWGLQDSIIKCDNLKMYLGFCNGILQSYETDNRGVLRYYIFLIFFFCATLQLCNGGDSSFLCIILYLSRIKHLSLLHFPFSRSNQVWERRFFGSRYRTTLWAAARGRLQHLLRTFPARAELSRGAVWELWELAGKAAHSVFFSKGINSDAML